MTNEEKAKAYDEALRKIRPLYERAKKEDCPIWSTYEYIFPELAESEDERIRKAIVLGIKRCADAGSIFGTVINNEGVNYHDVLTYLEKQKEQKKPNIELIQKSWYMEGYHDRDFGKEPKWVIKTGEGGPKYEENPKYGQMLKEEQKPVISNEAIREGIAHFGITQYQIDNWLKKHINVMEQKPVEPIEFNNEFENQVSHLLASALNGEHEYNEGFVKYAAQSLLGYAKKEQKPFNVCEQCPYYKDCPDYNEQKPVEWSEEDEDFINMLILHFNYLIDKGGNSVETYKSYREKLKALRPPLKDREMKLKILKYLSTRCSSLEFEEVEDYLNNLHSFWKPSREQLDALKEASASWMNQEMGNCELLESLYNDLKKL